MPYLSKKALSLYLRNGCERQFVLSLYRDPERGVHDLPPRQKARPGLGLVGAAGYEWQDQKVSELKDVFGAGNVHENPVKTGNRPGQIDLLPLVPTLQPYHFVVEARYEADTAAFRSAIGLVDLVDYFGEKVNISEMHPDIIQVLPPMTAGQGPASKEDRNPYELGVLPTGETTPLADTDSRLRLRVIDVKLTSEPGAHYFAEVVYYSITLAAWLIELGLDDRLVVVAAPAVWPGSHEASNLARFQAECGRKAYTPSEAEVAAKLDQDIEIAPFDVFAPRLRRLLSTEFPALLTQPWDELAWHVDHRCKGCEYLGYPWTDKDGNPTEDPRHCLPTAQRCGHLSRVFGLSRGASAQLKLHKVANVPGLAATNAVHAMFDEHQGLRTKRTVFPCRANSLVTNTTSIIPFSGGDALMPAWPDLHIYVFLDYDLSSAITAVIALRAFWREPLPKDSPSKSDAHKHSWPLPKPRRDAAEPGDEAQGFADDENNEELLFPIDERRIERERGEVLRFLRELRAILHQVQEQDRVDTAAGRRELNGWKTENSSYQIYLWDEVQRKQLARIIGRHLPYILNDPELRDLAWLFPPPELLPRAEDSTRQSPITLVSDVVQHTIAVPIPHHYRLVDIVETYHLDGVTPPIVGRLYQEPMSDLIPGERLHEWWQHVGNWNQVRTRCLRTARSKAIGMSMIVSRLEKDLKDKLSRQAAPGIPRPQPRALRNPSVQGRLWYEYARLNNAVDGLEIQTIRAMPPHEREARLKSARLTRRLAGQAEAAALSELNRGRPVPLVADDRLFVYEMRPASRDVNLKPGEFTWALAPELVHGFLDESPWKYIRGTSMEHGVYGETIEKAGLTDVKIEAIDRVHGYIALRASDRNRILDLERETVLRFERNVVLEPTHTDFLTDKIKLTVEGIGNPEYAERDLRALEALGIVPTAGKRAPRVSPPTPAAEVLWKANEMAGQVIPRDLAEVRAKLVAHFAGGPAPLDDSQWRAWERALTRRFSLLWGPPGTGKSRTLCAVVLGVALHAHAEGKPFRLLIAANTYTAVDNVLLKLDADLAALLPGGNYRLCRVQSKWTGEPEDLAKKHPDVNNIVFDTTQPSDEAKVLLDELEDPSAILILGTVSQQVHNLAVAGKSKSSRKPSDTVRSWFDLIILDEASQVDVGCSTLVFSKLAPGGSCVLAGDDLQLPPIQPAQPPKDLEDVVGSAYNYFRRHHNIQPNALDVNYRSNGTIVEFTRRAGYSKDLRSHSPELRLRLVDPIPLARPPDWPENLFWSPHWGQFLDPSHPTVTFIYDDRLSSQVNDFEADSVAALLWLLRGRLADRLDNERQADGTIQPSVIEAYKPEKFWERAVGVVTLHRAQMAKIVARLQQTFASDSAEGIRSAIDTVERFQGQQRDVIVASFGLGDPDIISAEDEFLYNLNRFNVLTSRARAKLIVLVSRSVLEHLSDDVEVLTDSRLLKLFAETYCIDPEEIELGYYRQSELMKRSGQLRRR